MTDLYAEAKSARAILTEVVARLETLEVSADLEPARKALVDAVDEARKCARAIVEEFQRTESPT